MDERASQLIETLGLRPHPEGGYYRELFRSTEVVMPADGRGRRAGLTTIYFLLVAGTHGRWHQVTSDEVWHLYEGGPLELLELDELGDALSRHLLTPVGAGGSPVHAVASRNWQAARPLAAYALVGCTVGPGFDFRDFRMLADSDIAEHVRSRWPEVATLI